MLPGCFSNGTTVEEAKANMREAIQQHIEVLMETGREIPQNPIAIHIEELTVSGSHKSCPDQSARKLRFKRGEAASSRKRRERGARHLNGRG
jgi:hypothetical protein